MDPITLAVLSALSAGAMSGTKKIVEKVIVDSYDALKSLIKRKFGQQSDVVKAIDNLEAKPDSSGRRESLQEEVAESKADQDFEILEAAKTLLNQLRAMPEGETHIQNASGNYIAQADRNSTATVKVKKTRG